METIESYLYELKEIFKMEIHEDFVAYAVNKFNHFPDSESKQLEVKQEVLADFQFFEASRFREKSLAFDESVAHYFYQQETLFENYAKAMEIIQKFGLTYLLETHDTGVFEESLSLEPPF